MAPLCQAALQGNGSQDPARGLISRHRRLERGGYIFREGDPVYGIVALCSGSAKTVLLGEDGYGRMTGFRLAGELIGTAGLATRSHVCDAQTLEASEICEVPLGRLDEVALTSAVVRERLLHLLISQLAEDEHWSAALVGHKRAEDRVAACLMAVHGRRKRRGLVGEEFTLGLSRGDIADYLGLAKETVSRILSRFQRDGLIHAHGRRIRLVDIDALGKLCARRVTGAEMTE